MTQPSWFCDIHVCIFTVLCFILFFFNAIIIECLPFMANKRVHSATQATTSMQRNVLGVLEKSWSVF